MTLVSWNFQLVKALSRGLPAAAAIAVAERAADLRHASAAGYRRTVQENLRLAGADPGVSREVFRNFGRYLVEFFRVDRIVPEALAIEGREHVDAARRQGGVLVLTVHVGHWELGGAALRALGVPLAAVALRHRDAGVNALFDAQRRRWGLEVIPVDDHTSARCVRALRSGTAVGVLGDVAFGGESALVRVFGRQVRLPRGPAVLAVRAGVPVLPAVLLREAPFKFRLVCEPLLYPARPGRGAVAALVEACAQAVERLIRRAPEQWLLMRPFDAVPAAPSACLAPRSPTVAIASPC